MTPDEADTFRLLDNRLGELSLWDPHALAHELSDLRALISLDDLHSIMESIRLTMPMDDLRDLLPLTRTELDEYLSRMRSDLVSDLSGGFYPPPPRLMDTVDTSAADAILRDPALGDCSDSVRRLVHVAAAQLIRFNYAAIRAYYMAAPSGSAIRAALIRHRDVVPVSAPERATWLKLYDVMADALRADFSASDAL